MIDMPRIRKRFGNDHDHAVHFERADAIAERDEAAAVQRSRGHLLAVCDGII